ncbi:Protein of unknown function [Thiothrix caldifontis]|uniref:Lcl C-terminal domain-containing protein n=1 Tax=Thiothrix caldifontis TaxID=525918 RepID=A0A1H3Y4R8_9GAMM|nr:DUF1566 domain-containing protein [Thiothrix caldifontis]SEA06665.1 Protein of unknown function [Thiothrix caldifontis]
MNTNPLVVNLFNSTHRKHSVLLMTSILTVSLLTGCGGGGGTSTQAQEATQSTTQVAANASTTTETSAQTAANQTAAAEQVAAAQAAAAQAANLAKAQESLSEVVTKAVSEAQAAKEANVAITNLAQQAETAAASYPAIAQSQPMTNIKSYVTQAAKEVTNATTQQTIAEQEKAKVQNSQDLAAIEQATTNAEAAATKAKTARLATETVLNNTWAAVYQIKAAIDLESSMATIPVIPANAEKVAGRYVKLDNTGKPLAATATNYSCVKDTQTNLVWEIKTNDGGLRDKDWRYRHFHNYSGYWGTVSGYDGSTLCAVLGSCDAYSYMETINSQGICGRKGTWRLPVNGELGSIAQINTGGTPPHINLSVFSDTAQIARKSAYCSMNTNTGVDAEHNYQGVDFTMPLIDGVQTRPNLENSILVALRLHGEVQDGLSIYPTANWVCYTRLVSDK